MWQELNETNQAGSGNDFFPGEAAKNKLKRLLSSFLHSYVEVKDRHSAESMVDFISQFLFIGKLFKNYSNYL